MKERPILVSGEMVRATLDGRKTQTRRPVKWKPYHDGGKVNFEALSMSVGHCCTGVPASGWVLYSRGGGACWNQRTKPIHCPYGAPGDRLWVRETFLTRLDGKRVIYRADLDPVDAAGIGGLYGGWKPSLHMPRWASRLTIEITDVRVERLASMSEADAKAEGFESIEEFRTLWNQINPKQQWQLNPWTWCLRFRKVKP